MAENKHNEEEKSKAYSEERKLLIELERVSAQNFDKAIITLSAGALGLSITFIRQIAPSPRPETLNWLYISVFGLIFALIFILSSFLCSQSAIRKQRDILDQASEGKLSAGKDRNLWAEFTNGLNVASIVFFIVGVLFLAMFSIKNLPQEEEKMSEKMTKITQPSKESIEKGIVPPKLPVELQPEKTQPNKPENTPKTPEPTTPSKSESKK